MPATNSRRLAPAHLFGQGGNGGLFGSCRTIVETEDPVFANFRAAVKAALDGAANDQELYQKLCAEMAQWKDQLGGEQAGPVAESLARGQYGQRPGASLAYLRGAQD